MRVIRLNEGDTCEPDKGWRRVSLAGSDEVSVEYFEKPAGHASPLHSHPQEQVCIVVKGKMRMIARDHESVELGPGDSVWFAANESHAIENTGAETAIGIDIFVPARSFEFWKNRLR
ncbi:cupin domain-containing protein [bacterium]|nr:cupin domain-containing protein [bacterium]MBU1984541.1 cupin domain-containing protein [bacterium]